MRRRSRQTCDAVAILLTIMLGVHMPVALVSAGWRSATTPAADTNHRIVARTLLSDPGAVAIGEGFVWVTHLDEAGTPVVSRFDPASGSRVGDPIPHGLYAPRVAAGDGAVWVAGEVAPAGIDPLEIAVVRIDAQKGELIATIDLPFWSNFNAVAVGFEAVWVADPAEFHSSLTRIDPATNQVVGSPIVTGGEPLVVATGFGAIWTADHDDGTVTRIDPASATVTATIEVGAAPHSMAVGAGAVWTGNWHVNSLTRIDPALNLAAGDPIALDFRPGAIVAGDDAVWVAAEPDREEAADDRVVRIDPTTGAVVETLHAGARVVALALTGDALWVVADEPDQVLKIALSDLSS